MKPSEPLPTAAPCPSGKFGYRSASAARQALRQQAVKHGGSRRNPTYECPLCHAWHSTHAKERGGSGHVLTIGGKAAGGLRPGRTVSADEALAELERMNRERTAR